MRLRFFCIFIGISISVFFAGGAGGEEKRSADRAKQLSEGREELKALQEKIEDKRSRISETQRRESKVLSELNGIEQEFYRKQQTLTQYERSLRDQTGKIEGLNRQVENLQEQLSTQQNNVAFSVKALYTLSRIPMVAILSSSESLSSLIQRYEYLMRIIAYDARIIDDYTDKLGLMQDRRQQLTKDERGLKELTEKTRATQEQMFRHRQDKTKLLTRITSEKELHLKTLAELEQAAGRLQGLIERLGKELSPTTVRSTRPSAKSFPALKKLLPFPVSGTVVTYFGKQQDNEFSTVAHSRGIEIVATMGTPITAVSEGQVLYADWFKGYGNIIIIDHGEGYYTLSGHASEVFKKVGDQIKEGETIGLVGDSGSLKGPNLYFEIRHHGVPLDPLDWLIHN